MDNSFGRISNRNPLPTRKSFKRRARQQTSRVAKKSLAAASLLRRDIAVEKDEMRDATQERAVPMKRNCGVGIQIIPRINLCAQVVDGSEFPFQQFAQAPAELRQPRAFERSEPAQDNDAMRVNPLFQRRDGDRTQFHSLPL